MRNYSDKYEAMIPISIKKKKKKSYKKSDIFRCCSKIFTRASIFVWSWNYDNWTFKETYIKSL